MAKNALSYFTTTLTQGSADAFVQSSVSTGLAGATKSAYAVREIVIEYPLMSLLNGSNLEVSLTRKSLTAAPNITDKSVVFKNKRFMVITTSGATIQDGTVRWIYGDGEEPLLVEDTVYFQLDSAATTGANTVYVRIGYVLTTITEVEKLTLIANSLQ